MNTVSYSTETADVVQKAVALSDKPLSSSQINKALTGPFKLDKTALGALVGELLAQKKIFDWSKNAKTALYWDRDPGEAARPRVIELLQAQPRTVLELTKEIKAALPYYPTAQLAALFQQMTDAGQLFVHPGKGKTTTFGLQPPPPPPPDPKYEIVRELGAGQRTAAELLQAMSASPHAMAKKDFDRALKALRAEKKVFASPLPKKQVLLSLSPPDPRPFLAKVKKEFDSARAKLALSGVSEPQFLAAAREVLGLPEGAEGAQAAPPTSEKMPLSLPLRLLKLIELTADQALISLRDLRRFAGRPKPEFDAAILQLQHEQRVALHAHDHAFGLGEDERNELVADDQGRYYVGVALREG